MGETSFYPFAATYLKYRLAWAAPLSPTGLGFSCMLWLKYGVYANDPAVVIVNGFGAIVAFFSMIVYYWYSHDKVHSGRCSCSFTPPWALQPEVEKRAIQVLGLIMVIFLLVRFRLFHPKWVGMAAMVASVLMFAAPLVGLVRAKVGCPLVLIPLLSSGAY